VQNVLKVHPADNVIVALQDLKKGETINFEGQDYLLVSDIPAKHKFLTEDLAIGQEVIMYGVLVGKASQPIQKGGLIHTQNLKHAASTFTGKTKAYEWTAPDVSDYAGKTFLGYHRKDGKVGTANYWLFVPTVFCENRNLDFIKDALNKQLGYGKTEKYQNYTHNLLAAYQNGKTKEELLSQTELHAAESTQKRVFPNIDGIKFLTHQGGCGGTRQDSGALAGLLAGYINHPNVCGITVLSLGCQHLQFAELKEEIFKRNPAFDKPLFVYEQQESLSEESLLAEAIRQTFVGLIDANEQTRQPAPLDKLVLGVKCGGSDGYSGISANPALGVAVDLLVRHGGAAVLSETPEIYGGEHLLTRRAVSAEVAHKLLARIAWWEAYTERNHMQMDNNPSAGNKAGGLTTILEKSLGAIAKSGTTNLVDVVEFAQPVTARGFVYMDTPGYDPVSATGQVAGGANLICFTTGRGSAYGCAPSPSLKLATNTALWQRQEEDMDINCGGVVDGAETVQQAGERIFEMMIATASGQPTKSEQHGYGQNEFVPWQLGAVM
jgi:altronate hydrolase